MAEQDQAKTHQDDSKGEQQDQEQQDQEQETITEVIDADDQNDSTEETDSADTETEAMNQLQEENDDLKQRLLRVQAEFDNFKRRSQKEKEAERKYKAEDLAKELLPVIDNFERAMQVEITDDMKSFADGISMVYNQIRDALKSQGVEEIESVGKPFDPNIHHAVMQVENEGAEPDTVAEELQKGYILKDRVIRPAMVKVNK